MLRHLTALALVIAAVVAFAATAQTGHAASCTLAEIEALQVPLRNVPVYDGWMTMADLQRAKAAACRLVAGRWSYIGNDFLRSTALVDRLWPGVGTWEKWCATSEGGWGRWVPNSQGSGAGGWLQFMSGTFYGVIDKGIWSVRAQGLHPPRWVRSWYSPLGHAIAGAQMIHDGRRGEWSGANC